MTEKSHFKIACIFCSYMYLSENIRKNIEKNVLFLGNEMPSIHYLVVCGCKKCGFAYIKELEIHVRMHDFQLIIIVLSIYLFLR